MKTADVLRIYIHTVDTKPLNIVAELGKKRKRGPDSSQVRLLLSLS